MLLPCSEWLIVSGESVIKVVSHSSRFVDCIANTARPSSNDRDIARRLLAQLFQQDAGNIDGVRRKPGSKQASSTSPGGWPRRAGEGKCNRRQRSLLHSPPAPPSTCEAYYAASAGPLRAIALHCCPGVPARLCRRDAPSTPPLPAEPMASSGSLPPRGCRHHGLTPYGSNRQRARTPRSPRKRPRCPKSATWNQNTWTTAFTKWCSPSRGIPGCSTRTSMPLDTSVWALYSWILMHCRVSSLTSILVKM